MARKKKPTAAEVIAHFNETLQRYREDYPENARGQEASGLGAVMDALAARVFWTDIAPDKLEKVVALLLETQNEAVLADVLDVSTFERKLVNEAAA